MTDLSKLFTTATTAAVQLEPTIRTAQDAWAQFNIDQIYQPGLTPTATHYNIVPKENDLVYDVVNKLINRVTHVDLQGTLASTYTPWYPAQEAGAGVDDAVIFGAPSTYTSEYILCGIDYSQMPPKLSVDNRIQIKGSKSSKAKIFLGSDISSTTGKVVSARYDNSGLLVDDALQLELIQTTGQNVAIRTIVPGSCNQTLPDGEVVTLVVYDQDGGVILPAYRMVVQNTAFVRTADSGNKFIKSVQLLSSFVDANDPTLLKIPVNIVSLAAVELRARVWYTDNTYQDWPVGSSKMVLNGASEYAPTVVGQRANFLLTYFLSSDEQANNANTGLTPHVDQAYSVLTIDAIGAFSPKLFGYPVWQASSSQYRMNWWLYTLDRQLAYEVTDKVEMGFNGTPFDPSLFGSVQHLNVAVSLSVVAPQYTAFRHAQQVQVALYQPATSNGTNWSVGVDPGQSPLYGASLELQLKSVAVGDLRVRVDSGLADYATWLQQLYYNSRPILAPNSELVAPEPTHFILYIDATTQYRFPIAQWNQDLSISTLLTQGQNVFVKWVKVDAGNTELQLGISALVAKA